MRATPRSSVAAALTAALALALGAAGCGQTSNPLTGVKAAPGRTVVAGDLPFVATKNTTRVAGPDAAADAAGVAAAVYPGAPGAHPQAVALVDGGDWQAALAACALMGAPLRAPLLLGSGAGLPAASSRALSALAPSGSAAAGGAQVITVGSVRAPSGLHAVAIRGANPFATAAAIDRFTTAARGKTGSDVIVVSATAPAFAMPAGAWSAKTGEPILFVTHDSVPPETRAAIALRPNAHIYVLGPASAVGAAVVTQLSGLGTVQRIAAADPVSSAIAFARYSDSRFGWGVVNPGHGLVFANASRPLDAVAAAPLSAAGTYGPLLLLDSPDRLPDLVRQYLLDIEPGYAKDPARGVYNHGWLIGDEQAISGPVQAQIDALLEIAPVSASPTAPSTTTTP